MSQDEQREEYLRLAALRISLLSEIMQLLREQLSILAARAGRGPLLESRDSLFVRLEALRDAEEQCSAMVAKGYLNPLQRLEDIIRCRRTLAGSVGSRLLALMDEQLPDRYPERRKLFFGGSGELTGAS